MSENVTPIATNVPTLAPTPLGPAGARWARYEAAASGLPEYWYPVLSADSLRSQKRIALKFMNLELVFFAEGDRFYALADRCPHRGVPLSLGSREFPKSISCEYHGWTFSLESGELVAALTDGPDSPVLGKARVRTFPVEERAGLIWVWTGQGKPAPVEQDIPAELLDPSARIYPHYREVQGNWRFACENGFDESHGKMLHRTSWWVFFRPVSAWNTTEIKRLEDGDWLDRYQHSVHVRDDYPGLGSWPPGKWWKKLGARTTIQGKDHFVAIRLPCILRVKQPGTADWTHYEWYMPINAERYRYMTLAVSWRKSLFKRLMFWLRYYIYILPVHHYGFNGQDLMMVREMNGDPPVHSFRPDVSIFEWRRHVEENARGPGGAPRVRVDAPARKTGSGS